LSYTIIKLLRRLILITPGPVKSTLKLPGFGKILSRFWDNYNPELEYQRELVKALRNNKSRVLEYWTKCRYLDEINAICNIEDNTKVLDVGCGISTVLHFIDGEKYGIDPLANKYKQLYSYPEGMDILNGYGEAIPFPNDYFDIVFCSSALDHMIDPQKTINETRRVLKPGGYLVLSVEVFNENVKSDHSVHSFTKSDVYSLLDGNLRTVFERELPRIALRTYVNGSRKSRNKELIMVLKKA
jgi:SAM-dependent methyltransferase